MLDQCSLCAHARVTPCRLAPEPHMHRCESCQAMRKFHQHRPVNVCMRRVRVACLCGGALTSGLCCLAVFRARSTTCAAHDLGTRCNPDAALAGGIENLGGQSSQVQAVTVSLLIIRGASGARTDLTCPRLSARVVFAVSTVTFPPCCVTCCQRLVQACGLREARCREAHGFHIRRKGMRQTRRCRNRPLT